MYAADKHTAATRIHAADNSSHICSRQQLAYMQQTKTQQYAYMQQTPQHLNIQQQHACMTTAVNGSINKSTHRDAQALHSITNDCTMRSYHAPRNARGVLPQPLGPYAQQRKNTDLL